MFCRLPPSFSVGSFRGRLRGRLHAPSLWSGAVAARRRGYPRRVPAPPRAPCLLRLRPPAAPARPPAPVLGAPLGARFEPSLPRALRFAPLGHWGLRQPPAPRLTPAARWLVGSFSLPFRGYALARFPRPRPSPPWSSLLLHRPCVSAPPRGRVAMISGGGVGVSFHYPFIDGLAPSRWRFLISLRGEW